MAQPAAQWPPNCRIFLGNLASEKTSTQELRDIFGKYGRVVEEPVLRRSFGFIQYDNPEAAAAAIAAENGRLIGGVRLDMSIADNRDRNEGRKKAMERKRMEQPKDGEREPRFKRHRDDGPPPRNDFRDDGRGRAPPRPPSVVHVIHLQGPQREYAMMIERAVRDLLGLPVETLFIDNLSIAQRLERSTQDGARYCIIVGPAHERTGTTNLHNLRAESRAQRTLSNVPYRETVEIIAREMNLPPPQWGGPPPPLPGPPGVPAAAGLDPAALSLLIQLAAGGAAAAAAPPVAPPAPAAGPSAAQLSALAAFLTGQGSAPQQPAPAYATQPAPSHAQPHPHMYGQPAPPVGAPGSAPNFMSTLLNLAAQQSAAASMSAPAPAVQPAYAPPPPPQPSSAPADALELLQNLLKKPAAAPAPGPSQPMGGYTPQPHPAGAPRGDPRQYGQPAPAPGQYGQPAHGQYSQPAPSQYGQPGAPAPGQYGQQGAPGGGQPPSSVGGGMGLAPGFIPLSIQPAQPGGQRQY